MKRITIKDIAQRLGVNASTVSRALADHPDISEQVKEQIKAAAVEMKYHPNRLAANLRQNRSSLVGLIIPEISTFFFPSVIRGIEQEVRAEGYELLVMQSNDTLEREAHNLQLCADHQLDGVLMSLSSQSRSLDHLEQARDLGMPIVLFDKSLPGADLDQILIDDWQAAYICTRHLISAGARRIGGLFGNRELTITRHRVAGYEKALAESGLDAADMPRGHVHSIADSRAYCKALLAREPAPDAFFCMSDEVAAGLMPALAEAGVAVPGTCKVIAISDGQLPYMMQPALTHYLHAGQEVGRRAARQLLARIGGDESPTQVQILGGEIVVLGSV